MFIKQGIGFLLKQSYGIRFALKPAPREAANHTLGTLNRKDYSCFQARIAPSQNDLSSKNTDHQLTLKRNADIARLESVEFSSLQEFVFCLRWEYF